MNGCGNFGAVIGSILVVCCVLSFYFGRLGWQKCSEIVNYLFVSICQNFFRDVGHMSRHVILRGPHEG